MHLKRELYFYSIISIKITWVHFDICAFFSTKELENYEKSLKISKIWYKFEIFFIDFPQKILFKLIIIEKKKRNTSKKF